MNAVLQEVIGQKQVIVNKNGRAEFVVLPMDLYEQLLELIEDYGLGLAIKGAEGQKIYTKAEAVQFLENDAD